MTPLRQLDWWSIASAASALVAAGFWFWSAAVPVTFGFLQDVQRAADINKIARLSAIAAVFAGISAVLSVVATIAHR